MTAAALVYISPAELFPIPMELWRLHPTVLCVFANAISHVTQVREGNLHLHSLNLTQYKNLRTG